MKNSFLLFHTSIVKLIAGCASSNVTREAVAVGVSFTTAKVSSTYLLEKDGDLSSLSRLYSIEHINMFARSGPRGAPSLLHQFVHKCYR